MELNKENYDKLKAQKLKRSDIAEKFGITDNNLKYLIAKNGWGKKSPTIKHPRIFKEITKESAYWIGFIAADGCVDDKGRVRIGLQKSDINHLRKFAKFIGSDHKISEDKEKRCDIEFTCREMVADLAQYGIVPRKSVTYHPGDLKIYEKYLREFFRGWFDGDGTICESFSNKNSITATLYTGIACSKPSYSWICDHIFNRLGISWKVHEKINHMTVTLNTNKSKILLDWMYSDSEQEFRLDRKYDLYVKTVVNDDRLTR